MLASRTHGANCGGSGISLPPALDDQLAGEDRVSISWRRFVYKSNFAVARSIDRELSKAGEEFIKELLVVDAEVAAEELELERKYSKQEAAKAPQDRCENAR
jgi:hypothetical protein